jgi:predicted nuclease with TOPRIM domain
MPSKTYQTIYKIDATQPQRVYKDSLASMRAMEAQALKTATGLETLLSRAGAAAIPLASTLSKITGGAGWDRMKKEITGVDVGLNKLQMSGIALQDRLTATATKGAAERQRIFDRAVRDEMNRDGRAVEQQIAMMERQARGRQKLIDGSAAMQATYLRREYTATEVNAIAMNRLADVTNRKRVDGAAKVMAAEKLTFGGAVRGALGLDSAVGKIGVSAAVATLGLQAALKVAQELGDAVSRAGQKSLERTAKFGEQRDQYGELATLMGEKADNKFTLGQAKFNAKVGFTADEGKAFLTEQYNSGAQFIDKTISKDEFKQLSEQGGRIAVARGGAATNAGRGDRQTHRPNKAAGSPWRVRSTPGSWAT